MRIIASLGLLLIVMGLSGGAWYYWERWGDAVIPAGRYLGEAGIVCIALAVIFSALRAKKFPSLSDFLDERAWTLGLAAIWLSDWICRPWGLFPGPTVRGELIIGTVATFALLRGPWRTFFLWWPLFSIALLFWSFNLASQGALLFSDDHTMFLFRLKLLKEHFPRIPFWSPLWNAGFDARDFFATGSLSGFFLFAPLIYAFPVESVYNLIITIIVWVLTPLSVFLAARLMGFSRLAGAISATISLCSGLFWYRWALKYGTMGFVVSTALFPLVVALSLRFISTSRPRKRLCVGLAATSTLMFLWSPSGIAALPLALIAAPKLPHILKSKRHLLTIVLLVSLNLPWMAMMWKVSKVGRFLDSNAANKIAQHQITQDAAGPAAENTGSESTTIYRHKSAGIDKQKSLNQWHNNASALNPIVVVFAVPALLSLVGTTRLALTLLSGWLIFLGTIMVTLKPQLELDRMVVIASVLLALPLGNFLVQFFSKQQLGFTWRAAASLAGSFILIGPFAASSMVLNRSDDTYKFEETQVTALTQALQDNASTGRVLFTGCVLHELSGGHLGPLPLWANTPMVASSYAHNIWKYEQPIPQQFLTRGDIGIGEYFDLMNATLVVAHEPTWVEYFSQRPTEYKKIFADGRFTVFRRLMYTPSYTRSGSASDFIQTSSSVSFIPQTASLVIKFRYFPFLESSACSIKPLEISKELQLIELSGCPVGQRVTIQSISPMRRLLMPAM